MSAPRCFAQLRFEGSDLRRMGSSERCRVWGNGPCMHLQAPDGVIFRRTGKLGFIGNFSARNSSAVAAKVPEAVYVPGIGAPVRFKHQAMHPPRPHLAIPTLHSSPLPFGLQELQGDPQGVALGWFVAAPAGRGMLWSEMNDLP